LPSEWLYGYADGSAQPDQTLMNQVSTEGNAKSSDVQQIDNAPRTMIQGKDGKVAKSKDGVLCNQKGKVNEFHWMG